MVGGPRCQTRLKHDDAEAPNRLLFDALAFGLSGILADDDELKRLGREYVDLAMNCYRDSDGVFLEKGGHDSSYQAVAALKLQVWTTHFADKKLDSAVDRAIAWELARIGPDGRVDTAGNTRTGRGQEQWMGHEKDVNLSEIALCLLYHYARTGDKESLVAARRSWQGKIAVRLCDVTSRRGGAATATPTRLRDNCQAASGLAPRDRSHGALWGHVGSLPGRRLLCRKRPIPAADFRDFNRFV